jgi:hypothetical protein
MIARTWPPLTYWLTADDRMVATAVEVLEAEALEVEAMTEHWQGGADHG